MANVNQATGPWLVGGEVLETEVVGRRKTFWPIKDSEHAKRSVGGVGERGGGAIYPFKWKERQISMTSSRPCHPPCLCHCDGALPQSPPVVWRREFWCPEVVCAVRGLIFFRPSPALRTVEAGCARVFCHRSHHPYVFMPSYIPRVFPSNFLTFKIRWPLCLEKSGIKYPVMQCHVPEEQTPHTYHTYIFYLRHCKSTIADMNTII
jgi:hypothetical protein